MIYKLEVFDLKKTFFKLVKTCFGYNIAWAKLLAIKYLLIPILRKLLFTKVIEPHKIHILQM